eukprot:7833175-Pyramimonas_sp.AAC.1
MPTPEAFLNGVQQIAEACPTVEHVERGNTFRQLRQDIVFVEWLVPGGCGEPPRAVSAAS